MTRALHRLVYFSRPRIAGLSGDFDAVVREILSVSRRNNARMGLTGALMFNSGCFVQVLEGLRAPVEQVYGRVRRDERHGDISLLSFEPVAERGFVHWSMAYVGSRESDRARHDAIAVESGFDPSRMSGQALFAFLKSLAHQEEREMDLSS